ncbi:MAG TPA: CarD family transcriptional regulator [Anaeromyxobacter sp.]|nr:CarD family transcriptional regulator [Anaeromyxobacter sp.]
MRGPPPRHPDEPREQLPPVEGFIADAADLEPGVRVVYPNQGVCRVIGLEEKDISGVKLQLVRMQREEDGAAVLVPRNKVANIGLRRVATGRQIEGVFHYLAAQFADPELDWKVRHRDNADRLVAGGVLGLAEVVKGLHSLSRLRPLPTKEREQYDNARHLLVHEVAVALNTPPGLAEDYIDYALMPPPGVKFDVPPPPAPVALPSRPRRRKPAAEEGDLGDLGLGDLGIDLDLDAAAEPPAEGAEGGEAAEEGAEAAKAPADEAKTPEKETEDKDERPVKKSAARPKALKKPAPHRPAKKPAKKPEKPARPRSETPREKTAKKPAPKAGKRGGKKK